MIIGTLAFLLCNYGIVTYMTISSLLFPIFTWYNKLSYLFNIFRMGQVNFVIKNNLEIDIMVKCMEEGLIQAQLTEMVGISAPYVNRIINNPKGTVNKFISMMKQLRHDI